MRIEDLAAIHDEDLAGLAHTPAARELLEAITATPRAAVVVTRRATFALAFAAVVAAAVLLVLPHHDSHGQQLSPVAFTNMRTGWIEAIVRNPFAAQAQLDAAFRREGLNVTVKLVPASPSAVGTVIGGEQNSGPGNAIVAITGHGCITGGGGPACPIGIRIRRDFNGAAQIWLGRPARLGESYESSNDSFAPGEALHCSGLMGANVARAAQVLRSMRLRARWDVYGVAGGHVIQQANVAHPPANDRIRDGIPLAYGHVLLSVAPGELTPLAGRLAARAAQLNRGCALRTSR